MYKIIDNVLPEKDFKNIKDLILDSNFPWKFNECVTSEEDNLPVTASYYFVHDFWSPFSMNIEQQSQIFVPLLRIMDCKAIVRIKANLYPSTETILHHENHSDFEFSHKGAIFYINTNNGLTILEDEIKVESIENRLLLFDPLKPHRSTTCTDAKCRINVNFNFF